MRRVQAVQLSEGALTALAEYLQGSGLQVGDRLPAERVMAERLGISRPILREALGRWAALGIIETRNGSGSYLRRPVGPETRHVVVSISPERHQLLQVLEVRRALEVEAAGLAALRRTPQDLERLRACYAAADRVQGRGGSDPEADWAFHLAVYRAAGNPYFEQIVSSLRDGLHRLFENPLHIPNFANRSWPLHRELLEAIERQDAPGARACVERILDIVQEDLRE